MNHPVGLSSPPGNKGNHILEENQDLHHWKDFHHWGQWQMGELYEIYLHDPDIHDGVITNLEPDIWEYEVKWA